MRVLAELAMKGRLTAILIAAAGILTGYFYWLGVAVVGLVSMRKGSREGSFVLAWSLLPAVFVWLWQGYTMPLASLFAVFAAALALRNIQSWVAVLLIQLAAGIAFALFLLLFEQEMLQALQQLFEQFIDSLNKQLQQNGQAASAQISSAYIDTKAMAGVFAVVFSFVATISVIIARWWQASLYNPGGFATEFTQIRLPIAVAAGLLLGVFLCLMQDSGLSVWSTLFALPLFFAGLALIHGWARLQSWPAYWAPVFYLLLVLLDPLKMVLVVLAAADSGLNFRGRLPPPPGSDSHSS